MFNYNNSALPGVNANLASSGREPAPLGSAEFLDFRRSETRLDARRYLQNGEVFNALNPPPQKRILSAKLIFRCAWEPFK